MSPTFHGPEAGWPSADSPLTPYHELRELAERAGVSIEHLCSTVERAMGVAPDSKAAPPYYDDFEEVVRHLADDEYDFELETKTDGILHNRNWHEWQHPRDDQGRFTSIGGTSSGGELYYPFERRILTHEEDKALKETKDIHAQVEKLYTGLKTRWSGETKLKHLMNLNAIGVKDWSCRITLAYELLSQPARRFCTILHESLHALSPTTQDEYKSAVGWEEAVIEKAMRLNRASIAQKLGLHFTQEEFAKQDENHPYSLLVKCMENMRVDLQRYSKSPQHDPLPFYEQLMHTPATKRKDFIRAQGRQLSPEDRPKFNETFERNAVMIDNFKHPHLRSETKDYTSSYNENMTRDEVVESMLSARTPKEVIHARQAIRDWAKEHPDDFGIWQGAEMVEMLADAYGIPKSHTPEYQEYKRRHPELFPDSDDAKSE